MPKLLALDPSKSATGWVIFNTDTDTIEAHGCYKYKKVKSHKRKTDEKIDFQIAYTLFLFSLYEEYKYTLVVSEYPGGSQSATAAAALAMCSQAVVDHAVTTVGIDPVFCLDSDAKKAWFDRCKNVEKQETIDAMYPLFKDRGYSPRQKHDGTPVKYEHEAICDALLVLNWYQKNFPSRV